MEYYEFLSELNKLGLTSFHEINDIVIKALNLKQETEYVEIHNQSAIIKAFLNKFRDDKTIDFSETFNYSQLGTGIDGKIKSIFDTVIKAKTSIQGRSLLIQDLLSNSTILTNESLRNTNDSIIRLNRQTKKYYKRLRVSNRNQIILGWITASFIAATTITAVLQYRKDKSELAIENQQLRKDTMLLQQELNHLKSEKDVNGSLKFSP